MSAVNYHQSYTVYCWNVAKDCDATRSFKLCKWRTQQAQPRYFLDGPHTCMYIFMFMCMYMYIYMFFFTIHIEVMCCDPQVDWSLDEVYSIEKGGDCMENGGDYD